MKLVACDIEILIQTRDETLRTIVADIGQAEADAIIEQEGKANAVVGGVTYIAKTAQQTGGNPLVRIILVADAINLYLSRGVMAQGSTSYARIIPHEMTHMWLRVLSLSGIPFPAGLDHHSGGFFALVGRWTSTLLEFRASLRGKK